MAKARSGLGRDFYSLLDDNILASDKTSAATNLRISKVEPRSDQPRKQFDQAALEALADSIAAYGVLQPILVRPNPNFEGSYEIIAGERRWRGAKMAGLTEIPGFLKTPGHMLFMAGATESCYSYFDCIKYAGEKKLKN